MATENDFSLDDVDIAGQNHHEYLNDLFQSLSHLGVKALAVLGPDPFGPANARTVFSVYPARMHPAAGALASSDAFGLQWRETNSPMVGWTNLLSTEALSAERWRQAWVDHGMAALVRVEMPLPLKRAFETYLFTTSEITDRAKASEIAYALWCSWPLLKPGFLRSMPQLTERERQCLAAAAEGLTAKQSAELMSCTERAVIYYWTCAMEKLRVKNKVSAVHRASTLGLI